MSVIYMVCDLWCGCMGVGVHGWMECVCRGVGTLIRISEGAKGSLDEAFCTTIC